MIEYWKRMDEICEEINQSFFQTMEKAEVSFSSSYQMKNKGVPPTVKTIAKFCDAANISLSHFFNSPYFTLLTAEQKTFLSLWNKLSVKEKNAIYRTISEFKKIKFSV